MRAENENRVIVVGAGLAGSEAAWQLAQRDIDVTLFEMKPERRSPAHASNDFAELVCSNSLRANTLGNAVGLLKEEMRMLDSLVIRVADRTAVPAGKALAVDRDEFSAAMTEAISGHPRIEVRTERITKIPEARLVILATGPLTDPELAEDLAKTLGEQYLYFYDAISPTIYADSIDDEIVFRASRYDEGVGDYLNVPLLRDEYEAFVEELLRAETVPLHEFEKAMYFEGCLPIEEMARRGRDTLAFGPLKPVGLVDPRTGRRPHAVVQLRQEDQNGTLWNLVGCQTKLRVGEQKRIIRALPGLGKAVFARFGSIHRNTYVNAPIQLDPTLQLKRRPGVFLAGQMAGVEGYVESAALGYVAGVGVARLARGLDFELPPVETAHGALLRHLQNADAKHFQPMNVNYGLFPPLDRETIDRALMAASDQSAAGATKRSGRRRKLPKREKNELLAARALAAMNRYMRRETLTAMGAS
ncbi:MAG TPA: methylenetetrahydrofolate--tRNA-(uracil(54)-C(5))-methyltransferase (FADH(2)-oxidizing) TrmFO [Myxococcales bacterium]|nr:methylenetetrahydrofolate--tRNA-(uracil(54)-C(5))-methyltransferase (FADH(2)-oxidizing) TrmFO [Myxococcales bacterium]HIK86660.1 methylenetetrahydrofolate--tRNA-(uracil(54)-C(5))-methyltransferase (FADH(2)-oxidizing) TrmFO [Myxococcales bacterium]